MGWENLYKFFSNIFPKKIIDSFFAGFGNKFWKKIFDFLSDCHVCSFLVFPCPMLTSLRFQISSKEGIN